MLQHTHAETAAAHAQARRARHRLLAALEPYQISEPRLAATAYVWPTPICPVGCGHCNFAAPPSIRDLARPRITGYQDELLGLLEESRVWKAVLSGGGEPMMEPEFCQRFISAVTSAELAEIELITSAYFAGDISDGRNAMAQLAAAWHGRPGPLPRFKVRISVDWFHFQRIGLGPAANLIKILSGDEYRDIEFYIRSVLLRDDDTMSRLAQLLGAQLTSIRDYQQELLLPDGRAVVVYYKNLILDGRITQRKLDRLPVGLPEESTVKKFGQRFTRADGRNIPARTYNGPVVKQLDGLACIFEDDGSIKILEGNAPDREVRLGDARSWDQVMDHYYADPITVLLVQEGPDGLIDLMRERYSDVVSDGENHNELYHIVYRTLNSPERLLFATLQAIAKHSRQGIVAIDASVLEREWRLISPAGASR